MRKKGVDKHVSLVKRRMRDRQRKLSTYGSETLHQAYAQKTEWVSKVRERKE
ncbi:MAG: hypothetical protein JSW72_09540 [Candidatus Bathyarchaeota archaeon]|nr:MAG: hypothetical protein JSW72_09540 [Candidatus Bathyarchaeota archaeon]